MPDGDLVETVVCLANSDGGVIYLGVENDGTLTGLHAEHQSLGSLAAMVANRTNPPVSVRVTALQECGLAVGLIEVPRSPRLVAIADGRVLRRRMQADGTPGCVPMYPHEFATRQSDLGVLDYSALPVTGATLGDLDPLERERLRQMLERYGGDRALLSLADDDLDGALGLARTESGGRLVTVTGLLLLGREPAIREHLPTHEAAFQVLDGTQVRVNEFTRAPLLRTFETMMARFEARLEEDEVQVGLFRVPVPTYDRRSFREAFVNALIHRDYTRIGAVHVRWEDSGLTISNPGGFVEGVTLDNLLVVEPKPRNPALADAVKRIGLAERTGRGVDVIYEGMLRFGRPAPDYGASDSATVAVCLCGAAADLPFLQSVIEEENRTGRRLPLDGLILLAKLRRERRVSLPEAARAIQRQPPAAKAALERLVEAGLIEARGATYGRSYMLSARAVTRGSEGGHP